MVEGQVGIESRRSTRVLARIPVSLRVGEAPPEHGVTAVVNLHGALMLSPVRYEQGTTLWIRNELNSEVTSGRVTWVGQVDASGAHKIGVEFVDESPNFWGSVYAEAVAQASN